MPAEATPQAAAPGPADAIELHAATDAVGRPVFALHLSKATIALIITSLFGGGLVGVSGGVAGGKIMANDSSAATSAASASRSALSAASNNPDPLTAKRLDDLEKSGTEISVKLDSVSADVQALQFNQFVICDKLKANCQK